jgi:hypothetical protein
VSSWFKIFIVCITTKAKRHKGKKGKALNTEETPGLLSLVFIPLFVSYVPLWFRIKSSKNKNKKWNGLNRD